MGIVWEAYHKRVPFLGVPENPIGLGSFSGEPADNFPGCTRGSWMHNNGPNKSGDLSLRFLRFAI